MNYLAANSVMNVKLLDRYKISLCDILYDASRHSSQERMVRKLFSLNFMRVRSRDRDLYDWLHQFSIPQKATSRSRYSYSS